MKKLVLIIGMVGIATVIFDFYQLKNLTEMQISFLPPAGEHIKPEETDFKVAFFSDNGLREGPLEKITKSISKSNSVFTIFCGDIADDLSFGGYSHLCEEMSEQLTIPLYAVPGNHDLDKDGSAKLFKKFFGQDQYYFSCGDTLFIALNTATSRFSKENQIWLTSILQKERQDYKRCVIYCHVPPADLRPGGKHCLQNEDADRFYEAIKDYSVSIIVAGHIHQYAYGKFHDVDLLILPSSGQKAHKEKEIPYGYVILSFHGNGTITHEVILNTYLQSKEYLEYYASIRTVLIFWIGIFLILFSVVMMYRSKFNSFQKRDRTTYSGHG